MRFQMRQESLNIMKKREHVKTVLVVDDDPEWQAFLCCALSNYCATFCASSGDDALRIAREKKPDAIILDVLMPGGKDGFTTFCELREDPAICDIPVVMLTAVNKSTKLEFGREGMERYFGKAPSAFLEKPIDPERLQKEIEKAIMAT